jgi:hypothetical protein
MVAIQLPFSDMFLLDDLMTSIPVPAALPQLLAYMLASPQSDRPVFGMATNGDEFVFLKLSQAYTRQYDIKCG